MRDFDIVPRALFILVQELIQALTICVIAKAVVRRPQKISKLSAKLIARILQAIAIIVTQLIRC